MLMTPLQKGVGLKKETLDNKAIHSFYIKNSGSVWMAWRQWVFQKKVQRQCNVLFSEPRRDGIIAMLLLSKGGIIEIAW